MEPTVILSAATNREGFAKNAHFTIEHLKSEARDMYLRLASSRKHFE